MIRRGFLGGLIAMTIPGQGGQQQRPFTAPGQATPPGVQAGVSGLVVRAQQVIISGKGEYLLVYSGNPAFGNLISSISGVAFTDSKGNAVLQGTCTYQPGPPVVGIQLLGNTIAWQTAATAAGPYSPLAELTGLGGQVLNISAVSLTGALTMPQAAVAGFPISGAATLAQVITAVNALYAMLGVAGVHL